MDSELRHIFTDNSRDSLAPAKASRLGRFVVRFIGVCCVLTVGASIFLAYAFTGETLSEAELAQLRPGMSESEVIGILGQPSSRSADFPNRSLNYLCYGKALKWNVTLVCFDSHGRYTGSMYE